MSWLIGGLVFLLIAGFAKLTAIGVNRLLAIPQPKWMVGATEIIQLSLIPLYAWWLIASFRKYDAELGNHLWNATTPLEVVLIGMGIVGFVLLVRSTIAFQRYRPPNCQIEVESRIVDFRADFKTRFREGEPPAEPVLQHGQAQTEHRPSSSQEAAPLMSTDRSWRETLVGSRPMRRIALLPGNEQFSVEVSTKTFSLPNLPNEWDGLSIVQLADTHFRGAVTRKYFEEVCEQALALKPDLFVFTGDLLDAPSLLDWLPETFGRLQAPLGQYFILGNHDWYLDANSIRKEFERHGWIDMASRWIELASRKSGPPIILAGDESPWMGTHPDMSQVSGELFRILFSHTPDNITWARDHLFDLMFAGHTHGGQIRLPLLGPVYSPSRFGCRFASGVFWLDPTLLYVSRGLSGREPIRYNCLPELTKLVLRSCDAYPSAG